jgi:hypothetical protein
MCSEAWIITKSEFDTLAIIKEVINGNILKQLEGQCWLKIGLREGKNRVE